MFRAYDKGSDISYSLGAFPTVELIKKRPEDLLAVALDSRLRMTDELAEILAPLGDKVRTDDRGVARVAKKGNVFMVGAFRKRYASFSAVPHVALHRPSDAGNLGTIMRTMLGFGIKHLAVVGDAADVYDPRTVRASMGAIFSLDVCTFPDFESYASAHDCPRLLFMLDERSMPLTSVRPPEEPYALVFGNEASGLPPELAERGTPVVIRHSRDIDSLNLPQAVAIGLYEMTKDKFKA